MKHGEKRFLSLMYVLSLLALTAFAIHGLFSAQTVSAQGIVRHMIILDAGHGGADGGASGSDGTQESDLNLAVTLKTDAVLGLLGEKTLLTRREDSDLSDLEAETIAQKKVTDIRNRVSLVNEHSGSILLSIHMNSFPQSRYYGPQVFYGSMGESKSLGELLQKNLLTLVPENQRKAKPISPEVYLMNHVTVPAVLVECGFLTNEEELEHLKSEDYQKQLAVILAVSAANHLGTEVPGV